MKLSCHTIIVPDYPLEGQHLVYQTRTQALVKIDQGLREILGDLENYSESQNFLYHEDIQHLHRMGVIVRDEQEEIQRLKDFLNQLKYGHDPSCFVVTVLTTYACNFKCTYCFEETSRTFDKLEGEAQEQVVHWLKRKMEKLGYKKLYLNYYGGEPLLNTQAIEYISAEMKCWCEQKGIIFTMALQTNGYLLTPELVDQYKKLNLKNVRISVDGVGKDHDRSRPLRGGGGTFDRVIKNIVDCVDKIPIGISIGYEKGQVEPIEKLVNYFEKIGVLHKLGAIITSPINPVLGPKGNPGAIRGSECMCNSEDKTLASATRKINNLLERKGVGKAKSGMATSICPLVRKNGGVTIDQKGDIYKCNTMLGHPDLAVGSVWEDDCNEKGREFRNLDVWKQCPADCPYLPMCSGGCRIMSFVGGNKNFKVASCKKPFLDEMAPEFIKKDYERMMKEKNKKNSSPAKEIKMASRS